MKYSHNYRKLKKDEYTTIRRYPKGKIGKRVMETYPGGMHASKIIDIKRIVLAFTDLFILQLDTDLETREEIYALFQSFYRKPIDFENDKFYLYQMRKVN